MSQIERKWNPGTAAVLSLVCPGAGQMYRGKVKLGAYWLFGVVAGYVAFIVPGLILHYLCIMNAQKVDPAEAIAEVDGSPTPETHVRCPDCREYVYKDARVCKHCRCALIPQV